MKIFTPSNISAPIICQRKTFSLLEILLLLFAAILLAAGSFFVMQQKTSSDRVTMGYTDPNDYTGTDIEKINAAIRDAQRKGGVVRIFKRKGDAASKRDYWLIDSAILLPGETTLYITNCKIKLSDRARDNWIRSANCMPGKERVEELTGIHIIGEGNAVLEGADRPRATGDGGKTLGRQTYGTDAGKAGEYPKGDWRNLGILLVKVRGFSLRNLKLVNSHSWAISLELCRQGIIRDLNFDSTGYITVDGKQERVLNQDGLDLRRGCRDIAIENITGRTGDDMIALSVFPPGSKRKTGEFGGTEFLRNVFTLEDCHVFNVAIRNVRGYCVQGYRVIRLLNNRGAKIHHVQITDVVDTSPKDLQQISTLLLGDTNYGGIAPAGDLFAIQISNVISKAKNAVLIFGPLQDSMISNVLSSDKKSGAPIRHEKGEKSIGLFFNNVRSQGEVSSN